uniref:Uncharacterized protein n=1 Tax=Candidatus Kentrum sp. DK TaxID=2126562 RepID=A0A450SVD1_9GAMM|nr:MAG: hypothetical protein BECKDK2373B_GA0170837_10694 [Candidatus Kentron sp. DK]
MANLLDRAVIEARKLPGPAQNEIGLALLSLVHSVSENAGAVGFPADFSPEKDDREEQYDLEDVNMAIARGIVEAKAHQRGEIGLPNARETLEALIPHGGIS